MEHLEGDLPLESDDDSIPNPSRICEWMYWLDIAGSVTGKSFKVAVHMKEWMIKAGFQNVTEKVYKLPIGGWPKDEKFKAIGQFNLLNVLEGVGKFYNMHILLPLPLLIQATFFFYRGMDMGPFFTGIEGEASTFRMVADNGDADLSNLDSGLRRGSPS